MRQRISDRELKSGFVTLSAVLVLGAIAVAVATSILLFGINDSKSAVTLGQMLGAKMLADGCAERGLERVRDEAGFSGTQNISIGSGLCSYTVIVLAGQARTINAAGVVGDVIQRVQISVVSRMPKITISSWQEVSSF